jgi:hypothetical protein
MAGVDMFCSISKKLKWENSILTDQFQKKGICHPRCAEQDKGTPKNRAAPLSE